MSKEDGRGKIRGVGRRKEGEDQARLEGSYYWSWKRQRGKWFTEEGEERDDDVLFGE